MDAQRFLITGAEYDVQDPCLQEVLARVYESTERPRCMCVPGSWWFDRRHRSGQSGGLGHRIRWFGTAPAR
ncbi:MAG: DUF1173 domain-containing protein, partial [Desulfovibrionaceae bacterium]|nr:DUF1173 domain-containing protein [Desulfovibrionaceae bacterium]